MKITIVLAAIATVASAVAVGQPERMPASPLFAPPRLPFPLILLANLFLSVTARRVRINSTEEALDVLRKYAAQHSGATPALGKRQFETCPFDTCMDKCDNDGPCWGEGCEMWGLGCWLGCCAACGWYEPASSLVATLARKERE